jgi:hypothetical protein
MTGVNPKRRTQFFIFLKLVPSLRLARHAFATAASDFRMP